MNTENIGDELCAAVKPLKWGQDYISGAWYGNTPPGIVGYVVRDGCWQYRGGPDATKRLCGSDDAAKSSAEADYAARVLSEITLRSAAEVRAEALREAADLVRRLDTGWCDGISGDYHQNTPEQMRMHAVQVILAAIGGAQ